MAERLKNAREVYHIVRVMQTQRRREIGEEACYWVTCIKVETLKELTN
jgi:hypothetical protein